MPTYSYPGVYVEEVPPLARPIAGVSTSVAGFIGIASDLAADKMPETPASTEKDKKYYTQQPPKTPKLVTSWNEFKQSFGDVGEGNKQLALAIYGFFANGGNRCWVCRIAAYDSRDFQPCLEAFAAIDEISIVAAPGVIVPAVIDKKTKAITAEADIKPVHTLLIEHCNKLKDRIGILDCDEAASKDCTKLTAAPPTAVDEGYAALYCPWITVSDPSVVTPPGATVSVPPSGAIAGIYARTDAERGVHKAPANELVRGALDLQSEISKVQQGALNDIGVNCIRNFYGSIRVWGARTLATKGNKPEWKYVNVRRFMIFLQESIEKELQWVVFEPNDLGLWQRISRSVSDFLLAQWRAGALFGETPKQAFFVRCDASTNPPDVRELGQVVTEIGVAVVKPAEFVIFRIQQQTGG